MDVRLEPPSLLQLLLYAAKLLTLPGLPVPALLLSAGGPV